MSKSLITEFSKLISNYKNLVKSDHNQYEVYKWKCVKHFQSHFNINDRDFERMLKTSINKANNLIFQNSLGFILKAAKHYPEETRRMFKKLYNESKDLQIRLEEFQTSAKNLLPDVIKKHGKPLNHQQDERTISFYMSMKYPEKYPLFKDDLYKLLINVFPDEKPQRAGRKYSHYIKLSKKVIPIIENDKELLKLSGSTLDENSFSGNQLQLIFQDILWRNRPQKDVTENINYYLLGAYWDGEDKTNEFVENGTWENGYDDKFIDETNSIKPGSRVAIKAAHTEAKTKSVMTIKAIGTVTNNHQDGRILDVDWDADFSVFKVDFSGGYWGTVHQVENEAHINAIFFREENKTITYQSEMMAHNLILYGPPGTGKTFNSIDKAVEIAAPKGFTPGEHEENKSIFDVLRQEGQIEFVTFHQNYSYEDFMVGIKPDAEFEQLRFKPYKGIFYQIAKRARENYLAAKDKSALSKTFDEAFGEILKPLIEENIPVKIRMVSGVSYSITDISDYSIHFEKSKGESRHSLSIQTLKDVVDGIKVVTSGLAAYYYPLVEDIKELMKPVRGTKVEELKKFVLIIDEINRANISRVFGELITLLEDDKRIGEPNELRITLPNGEKDFGIPPNLYVIGTMNTADKSIALIDIALRRRFEFIGYYPNYELPQLSKSKVALLRQINKNIYNKKKSADYLIGHAYFLNNSSIDIVLRNKIIPLLMEYFSGKPDIVSELFEGSNLKVTYNEETYSWDIQKSIDN